MAYHANQFSSNKRFSAFFLFSSFPSILNTFVNLFRTSDCDSNKHDNAEKRTPPLEHVGEYTENRSKCNRISYNQAHH
jgi:hypothetical protein